MANKKYHFLDYLKNEQYKTQISISHKKLPFVSKSLQIDHFMSFAPKNWKKLLAINFGF